MPRRRLKNREATDENPLPESLCRSAVTARPVRISTPRGPRRTPRHTGAGTREGLGFPAPFRGA
jgi:hypothetical protein